MNTISMFFLYKAISLLVGLLIVFMGYRLFVKGISQNAGELDASHSGGTLSLKNAAPGTFFALFGAFIISMAVFKKMEVKDRSGEDVGQRQIEILDSVSKYPVVLNQTDSNSKKNLPSNFLNPKHEIEIENAVADPDDSASRARKRKAILRALK